MSIPTILEKQILATIVYYDILDYPLTGFEVFLYLVNKNQESRIKNQESSDVCDLLNTSEYLKKYISRKLGFYFLKNQVLKSQEAPVRPACRTGRRLEPTDIIQQRLDRKKLADQKWKKIKKIFWIMQIIPFMKMVLVSGSLALGNSRKESDVDLIITAKKGRIWMARTLVTLLTSVLGVRRYRNKTEDKICLNHYVTDKSLKIPFESLYNAQSYLHLINVYDSEKDKKLFREFQEENKWIGDYVQNYEYSELGSFRSIKRNKILNSISKFSEFALAGRMGDYLENALSKIQSNKIKKDQLYKKSGGRITINNDQLEFHPDSHEANIIPEFNRRMEKLGLFEFGGQKDSGLNV
ncbi:hypothetical protein KAT63_03860 [Candidatus Parcubacteria bacterium]|nr:hypothetical protein [Candidatus Parcubacteria bacterium]